MTDSLHRHSPERRPSTPSFDMADCASATVGEIKCGAL
ncbi:hypothetical protein BIWAKO_02019 [Bosea sp. BIWAKO-01]|nr:hypothetical protein BIWAKO_02019 [Bosea sp. BIWAKO-01]